LALQKASIWNWDTRTQVVNCQYNPNELSISKSNQWEPKQGAGWKVPDVNFGNSGPRTLTMTLIFDTYEEQVAVTTKYTDKVMSLMEPSREELGGAHEGAKKRPPHVQFIWGDSWQSYSFVGVITQASQRFTLFLENGTPARATLQVTVQEVPKDPIKNRSRGPNPTSHAAGARRVRVVQLGDTIDWIAAEELGDATKWRTLADFNGIDDPRRLQSGQTLLVPPEA
jgi:hypothetical protein